MKKVMLVFGTRPEAIKMCPLVNELKTRKGIETAVCVTGQHRQMLDQVLEAFSVVPDYDLSVMKDRQTLFDVTTNILNRIREVLETVRPDVVLVHGDTSTTFVTALACYYLQIPVGHVEAGLRTYNIYSPYPEEFNRQAVGIISKYNFAPTQLAADHLIKEGKDPDSIYVAKNKSPLLIGLGDGYNMVCSDAMAMIRETSEFMEIHDKELVVLTKDSVTVTDYDGNLIERESYTAELDLSDIGKGTYPYYMLKEIDEQPTVMRKLINTYADSEGNMLVGPEIVKTVQECDRIYILAAGTSYNAGFASKAMLEKLTDTPVELGIASEWGYNMPLLSKKPMFILLSQSGETADSRQVLVKANQMGIPSLTVTNVPGSTLSREATYTMLLHAGPEIAVASTKAYTAQIAALAFLAKAVGEANGKKEALEFDLVHELSIVAQSIEATLSEKDSISEKVEALLKDTRNAFYIGRGNDYYVAMEASLKLKEISYIQCEGFAAGELKHGTISLIEDGTPVLGLISSSEAVASHTRGNIQEVSARGANVLTIVEEGLSKPGDDIVVNRVHPYLTSISMVIPTQLIAYFASLQRGLDVDKPRNLAKAVTVE